MMYTMYTLMNFRTEKYITEGVEVTEHGGLFFNFVADSTNPSKLFPSKEEAEYLIKVPLSLYHALSGNPEDYQVIELSILIP